MSPNSDRLRKEFDRRLGRRSPTAKAANVQPQHSGPAEDPRFLAQVSPQVTRQRISTGKTLPADVKKMYQRQFGRQATGGTESAASKFQRTMNKIVDDTVRDIQTRIDTELAIEQAMENPAKVPVEKSDPGIWGKLIAGMQNMGGPLGVLTTGDLKRGTSTGNFISNVEGIKDPTTQGAGYWQGLMEDFTRSPAGRALDIVSRPAYGVAEGLQAALESGYGTDDGKKDDFWHSFDDLASGAWRGLSGQDKTGFGQVWQTMINESPSGFMEEYRDFSEDQPGAAKWINRGVGAAGEIFLDPTNYASLGAAGIVKNTGEMLTETSAKAAVRDVVDTATRDFYDDVVLGGMRASGYRPSQDAIAARAAQAAEDSIERNLLDISAGANAGWGKMGTEASAQATANRVANEVRETLFAGFDRKVNAVLQALEQEGNLPIRSWRTHINQSPEFEDMIDNAMMEAEKNLLSRGKPVPWTNRDQFIAQLGSGDAARIRRWANHARDQLDAPLQQYIVDTVYTQTRDLSYNTIGIKIRGKTHPIKAVGRVYSSVKNTLPEGVARTSEDAATAMSFERNFPGRISLMTQHNKSLGLKAFESFRDDWRKIAREYTQQEAKEIMKGLEDPSKPLVPKLERGRTLIRNEYNKMFAEEIAAGARPSGSAMADDYAFIFNKGGRKEERAEFKAGRKKEVTRTNPSTGRFKLDEAKRKRLHPVEDAFEALLLRKLKSTRDLSRAYFMKDLIENFGFFSKPLTDFARTERKLAQVDINTLPQYMRDLAKKEHGNWYLPQENMKMFETYTRQSGWNPADKGQFIRNFNKITNIIKYLSTVPRPGFHIRNMIGDYYMGLLDGVPSKTYPEIFEKWMAKKAGRTVNFAIAPGVIKSWDEMKGLYERYANSGFFDTDIPLGGDKLTSGQVANNARKRVANIAREGSDLREDFGRFAHFVAAYRQEYNALLKKGIKDQTRLAEKTLDASVWRVNRYKFDYGALTATERKLKMLFPFYTFARKATPVLAAQLALDPHLMGLVGRFMEYNDGSSADNFNHYYIPDYLKDMGYGVLTDEDEPLLMRQDIMPTSVLNTLDFTSAPQFAQSVTSMANPMVQFPFEVALGEQLFSGQATGPTPQYLQQKLPIPGWLQEQLPLPSSIKAEAPDKSGQEWWLRALSDSEVGAGIPVTRVSEDQQDWGFRNMEDRFIQDPFSEFNRQDLGIRVYQSNRRDGTSFRVENTNTGEILYEGTNPSQALQMAKRAAGQ